MSKSTKPPGVPSLPVQKSAHGKPPLFYCVITFATDKKVTGWHRSQAAGRLLQQVLIRTHAGPHTCPMEKQEWRAVAEWLDRVVKDPTAEPNGDTHFAIARLMQRMKESGAAAKVVIGVLDNGPQVKPAPDDNPLRLANEFDRICRATLYTPVRHPKDDRLESPTIQKNRARLRQIIDRFAPIANRKGMTAELARVNRLWENYPNSLAAGPDGPDAIGDIRAWASAEQNETDLKQVRSKKSVTGRPRSKGGRPLLASENVAEAKLEEQVIRLRNKENLSKHTIATRTGRTVDEVSKVMHRVDTRAARVDAKARARIKKNAA